MPSWCLSSSERNKKIISDCNKCNDKTKESNVDECVPWCKLGDYVMWPEKTFWRGQYVKVEKKPVGKRVEITLQACSSNSMKASVNEEECGISEAVRVGESQINLGSVCQAKEFGFYFPDTCPSLKGTLISKACSVDLTTHCPVLFLCPTINESWEQG